MTQIEHLHKPIVFLTLGGDLVSFHRHPQKVNQEPPSLHSDISDRTSSQSTTPGTPGLYLLHQ